VKLGTAGRWQKSCLFHAREKGHHGIKKFKRVGGSRKESGRPKLYFGLERKKWEEEGENKIIDEERLKGSHYQGDTWMWITPESQR